MTAVALEQPSTVCREFAAAIAAGDLNAVRARLARHGALLTPDATTVRGREDAVAVLAQLIAADPQIEIESSSTLEAADVALVRQSWRITLSPAAQRPLSQRFETTLVLRRIEAEWKLTLIAPWGLDGARGARVDQIEGSQT
jgi:ketosteroid isomerase-like protein